MSFSERMRAKACELKNRLVLPEAYEERTLKAARQLVDGKMVSELFLIGDPALVSQAATKANVKLDGITVIHPEKSDKFESYAQSYYEKRKAKGMTLEEAQKAMASQLGFGAMMLVLGDADAMVAGAENTTADVLRTGLKIIGTKAGMKTASSCFVVETPNTKYGSNGVFIFSDCAVIPSPNAEQLADIAQSAAESFRTYVGGDPIVALLSYSTKGSGGNSDENILKVQEAVKLLDSRKPDFVYDGEIQLDCAVVPSVMEKKAPGSAVKGMANTLIFPNLSAGNIGYKLVQRLANAEAYGPFLQGFAKPLSDLSRGCSVEDIITTAAVTLVQAGKR